jgi:hypothetical protein
MAALLARLLHHLRDLLATQAREWLHAAREAGATAWALRPTGDRVHAVAAALLLAVVGLGAVAAQARRPGALPDELDWRAAGALLERDGRPGDAVVVAPAWLERARQVVPAALPVVAARRLDGERLPGVRRVWLLAAPAALRGGGEAERDLSRRADRADAQRLGQLEVIRFDLAAPALPLAELADRAPDLAALREAGGLPRRCLVFQPTPGAPLVRPFPLVPLGRSLAGHAALLPGAGDAPVRVAFQVEGVEVGAVEVADGAWTPFELDTARLSTGRHDVEVVVTAGGAAARPVCLEALALP